LRGPRARPEPDRLLRAALDRMGRFRHGPRMGRAGCARLRPARRLRAVRGRVRRRDATERRMSGIGAAPGEVAGGSIPEIGVGMLGYAFMGKAHSNAFRKIPYMTWPPPFVPKLVSIAGRNEEAVRNAAERYGYE